MTSIIFTSISSQQNSVTLFTFPFQSQEAKVEFKYTLLYSLHKHFKDFIANSQDGLTDQPINTFILRTENQWTLNMSLHMLVARFVHPENKNQILPYKVQTAFMTVGYKFAL